MPLPTPGPAEIIRAAQKDSDFIKQLREQIDQVILRWIGQGIWFKYKNLAHFSSVIVYYALTNLSGFQTLGEEYAGIVQVDPTSLKVPNKKRILTMVLLNAAGRFCLDMAFTSARKYLTEKNNVENRQVSQKSHKTSPSIPYALKLMEVAQFFLPLISQFHLALFYLQGKFYHVSKRLVGIHYVLVRKWFANQNDSSRSNLKIIMWMSLVNLFLTACHDWMSFTKKTLSSSSVAKATKKTEDDDSNEKCCLCLEVRISPCVTPCGHVFCWMCVLDCLRTKNECPVCRDEVNPSSIVPLQNYN